MAGQSGRITNIGEHYGSKSHVRVEVTHGKRKRSKGPDGEKGELMDHSRPSSSVVIPKEHAKGLKYGDRVKVHLSKDDAADEQDGDEEFEDEVPTSAAPAVAAPAKKAPPTGGKKSAKKGKAPAKGSKRGPIFKAITGAGGN